MGIREDIERFYPHTARIVAYEGAMEGSVSVTREREVYSGVPCRLCRANYMFSSSLDASGEYMNTLKTRAKLLLPTSYHIAPGSRAIVTCGDLQQDFTCSGDVTLYDNHQEILLHKVEMEV